MTVREEFGIAFHVHHLVPWEVCEGYTGRLAYIEGHKPAAEQATRKRLLKMVPDELLPVALRALVVAARQTWTQRKPLTDAYDAQREPLDDAYYAQRKTLADAYDAQYKTLADAYFAQCKPLTDAYDAQCKTLDDALTTHSAEMEALHGPLCSRCPWDGKTIFPTKEAV